MPCVAMKNVKSPHFGQQLLGMRNDPPLITVVKSFKGERMHKYIYEVKSLIHSRIESYHSSNYTKYGVFKDRRPFNLHPEK